MSFLLSGHILTLQTVQLPIYISKLADKTCMVEMPHNLPSSALCCSEDSSTQSSYALAVSMLCTYGNIHVLILHITHTLSLSHTHMHTHIPQYVQVEHTLMAAKIKNKSAMHLRMHATMADSEFVHI